MSVGIYEYLSEKTENELFIAEVSRFNEQLDREYHLIAEASMFDTFKKFVVRIYDFIKGLVSKIVAFFTGKKSSGGGGGGGGGSSAPSPSVVNKSTTPQSVVDNQPNQISPDKKAAFLELIKTNETVRNTIKEIGAQVNITEVRESLLDLSNPIKFKGIIDGKDLKDVLETLKRNKPKEFMSIIFSESDSRARSILHFSDTYRNIDAKTFSKEFFEGGFAMVNNIISIVANEEMWGTNPMSKTLEHHRTINKVASPICRMYNRRLGDTPPKTVLGSNMTDAIIQDIKNSSFMPNTVISLHSDATMDNIKDLMVEIKDGKVPYWFKTNISNFHAALFPHLGIFDLTVGRFTRVKLEGYAHVSQENIDGFLKHIQTCIDNLVKESNESKEAMDKYVAKKESLMVAMSALMDMLNVLNYGDAIFAPNLEKIYQDLVQSSDRAAKICNEAMLVQAVNAAVCTTIDDVVKADGSITQEIKSRVQKEIITIPVSEKANHAHKMLSEVALNKTSLANKFLKKVNGEEDAKLKKALDSIDDHKCVRIKTVNGSLKGFSMNPSHIGGLDEEIEDFVSQCEDVFDILENRLPADTYSNIKSRIKNIKTEVSNRYKQTLTINSLGDVSSLFYISTPLQPDVINAIMKMVMKFRKKFNLITDTSISAEGHNTIYKFDSLYRDRTPIQLKVVKGGLDSVGITNLPFAYYPTAEGSTGIKPYVCCVSPVFDVIESQS